MLWYIKLFILIWKRERKIIWNFKGNFWGIGLVRERKIIRLMEKINNKGMRMVGNNYGLLIRKLEFVLCMKVE